MEYIRVNSTVGQRYTRDPEGRHAAGPRVFIVQIQVGIHRSSKEGSELISGVELNLSTRTVL